MTTATKPAWHRRLRDTAEKLGLTFAVSLIVSGVVSSGIGYYFESRLENSKERVEILVATKDKFDETHNALIARVGLFTNETWANQKSGEREKILETIITAQAQLLELRRQLGDTDDPTISAYAMDLTRLQDELAEVSGPNDLRPVYVSVMNLLAEHDKIAAEITKAAKVPNVI